MTWEPMSWRDLSNVTGPADYAHNSHNYLHALVDDFDISRMHVPCHYLPCYVIRCLGFKRSDLTGREIVTKDETEGELIQNYILKALFYFLT